MIVRVSEKDQPCDGCRYVIEKHDTIVDGGEESGRYHIWCWHEMYKRDQKRKKENVTG